MADLTTNVAGVAFKNPIITASGTFGFGKEYAEFYDLSLLGGICTKGLTLKEKAGNPPSRIAETPSGILNSVGLQNPGVDVFLEEYLPFLKKQNTVVIANVAGSILSDYEEIARRVSVDGVDMIELNISCPNVKEGGQAFGVRPSSVEEVTKAVRKNTYKPLIVKLTPNVADIADNARAAEAGGADAVSLINTVGGMAIDAVKRKPVLANVCGGLSGPAVKPIALKMVYQTYKAVKIPIIGMGGIMSGRDAAEFLLAGASAVQIGTANLSDPLAARRIITELDDFLDRQHASVKEYIGALEV